MSHGSHGGQEMNGASQCSYSLWEFHHRQGPEDWPLREGTQYGQRLIQFLQQVFKERGTESLDVAKFNFERRQSIQSCKIH